ncbi:glutamate racemase [Hydrogenophaga sp.]|uniref:glutamate racemase n=1 Tax=Hydrogenophaga sp. TaxID=1904254 RepID=UPI002635171B|nr:glutamate racemase [Hydrogenophaga sp.]MCW5652811.1 glutamate racemase [Hydrogenophaga sp.]
MKTVGVFDSGVGGLSVLRALLADMPDTRFVYVADSGHAPYGEREPAFVEQRSAWITDWLRQQHAIDTLVVACNTATALAIDALRRRHPDLPVVGVEPALKPAAALSRSGHVGVLATRGTLGSERFRRLQERLCADAPHPLRFTSQACDGLADAIERHESATIEALCEQHLAALHRNASDGPPIDTLVLGCTHYPFAMATWQRLCGPGVQLVDTATAIARRTREVLPGGSTVAQGQSPLLYSSGPPDDLTRAAQRWLGLTQAARSLGGGEAG